MPGTLLSILQALEHLLTEIVALLQTDFFLRFLFYVHRCFACTCVDHMCLVLMEATEALGRFWILLIGIRLPCGVNHHVGAGN